MPSYLEFVAQQNAAQSGFLILIAVAIVIYLNLNFVAVRILRISPKKLGYAVLSFYVILPTAVFLRLPYLLQSLWYDETFTLAISRLDLFRAFTVIMGDVHPPLAYFMFWVTSQALGIWALRLSPFLAGIAIVYAFYRLAKPYGEETAKVAATIAAIMPSLIWYSAEARAYSFLVLAVLVALIAEQEKRYSIFAFVLGILPLLHVYGYLYAFVIGLYVLWRGSVPRRYLAAAAVAPLLWLPGMLFQSADVSDGFWTLAPQLGGAFMPLIEMQIGLGYPSEVGLIVIPFIAISSFLAMRHNFKAEMIRYWVIFLGIPVLAFAISWLWHPIYIYRALLPAVSLIIIFYARWIVEKKPLAIAFLYIAVAIVLPYRAHPEAARLDLRSFVAACDGQPIYTIDVASAIIADAFSSEQITLYSDYNNWNQSLPSNAVAALGYTIKNLPARGACLYWQDTPMTTQDQRALRVLIVSAFELNCERLLDKRTYVIEVCR